MSVVRDESRTDGATSRAAPSASGWLAPERRGRVSVSAMGISAVLAFTAVLLLFTQTRRLQVWGDKARWSTGSSGRAWALIVDPLLYISVGTLGLCLTVSVIVACLRRRFALAAAAVALVVGSNLTTQLFKTYWPTHPKLWENSLPSGHSTAAMSTALAALLVVPATWRRWLIPISAFLSTFVGAGTIVGHWHRPEDVVAAFLNCLAWSALAIGLVLRVQHRRRARDARYATRPGLAVAGASLAGLVFILAGVRPLHHEVKWMEAALTFSSIGLLSALVVTWVAAAAADNLG